MKVSLFQGVLLGTFGVGALLGLFVFATYSSKGNGDGVEIGPVSVWGVLPASSMEQVFAAGGELDKSIRNVTYIERPIARFKEDLTNAIATGNAPDLVLVSQEHVLPLEQLVQAIPSTSISARTFESAFVGEGQLFESSTGIYGLPFLVDPLIMYTNRTLLASSGIAKPPSTWEALTGLVPKVTTLTSSGKITRSLIPIGTYDNVHNALGILSALFLQTGVPMSAEGSSGLRIGVLGNSISADTGVPAGQSVLRFYTQFADPTKVSFTWDASRPDSQQAFINGEAALYLGYGSEALFLHAANPNLDFDVAQLPQPATATTKLTYGRAYAFMIPRGAKNPSGAYQIAALMTNNAQQQTASALTGLAPASVTALSNLPGNSILDVVYTAALYARGWLSPAPADTDRVFSSMIGNVTSGRLTLPAALSNAEKTLSALLQQ